MFAAVARRFGRCARRRAPTPLRSRSRYEEEWAGLVDWAAVAASALGPLEQRLESRVASLEEARQREHAAQAERLATLTAELANERMLRQAAESCLAMAERHGAQLGGITLVATIVLAVVATAGLGAVGASLRR